MKESRRDFIKSGAASVACGAAFLHSNALVAQTLKLPLGLQLYSVRDLLPTDYVGTLKQIGALGYKEVESAGYYNHSAAEVKQAISDAGLKLVSAHHPSGDLQKQIDSIIAFSHEVGVGTIVCSSPSIKDPSRLAGMKPAERRDAFTLDDWKWNADQFNTWGEKVHAAGMNFGYHNHIAEFHEVDGVVPYVELMRLTDPTKVTMEMDCGWVIVGGGNPIELLRKYPKRITMLHVKDFKKGDGPVSAINQPQVKELGQGSIDYQPILEQAAQSGNVKHCFVEQEAFDLAPMECLKIDAEYMHKLGAS